MPDKFDAKVLVAIVLTSMFAIVLLVAGMVAARSTAIYYLGINLLLAFIPLLMTYLLLKFVKRRGGWSSWVPWAWAVVWLVFLPNSFYLVTDISHLLDRLYGLDPMFAVVLFGLFGVLGVAIGLESVFLIHRSWKRDLGAGASYLLAELAILLSSVAIYLGNVLRYNSWDVIARPFELAHDMATGLINLNGHGVVLIFVFFMVLSGLYAILWQSIFRTNLYLKKIDF